MAIFTHLVVGTNDLAKARAFYDKVLEPLGLKRLMELGDNGSGWGESGAEFFVLKPANGQPATHANGGTVSFAAPSRAAVSWGDGVSWRNAFHSRRTPWSANAEPRNTGTSCAWLIARVRC